MSGVSKSFGATRALDDVSFELGRGEVHALIGENGAGKSTLMKILSGAIAPDAGGMEIDGRPYAPSGPGDGRRCGVSMIYQELNLAPHLTVEENIMLGREVHAAGWLDRAAMRRKVREVLELVRHPEISPDVPVGRLSVGARQLVEIARALLNESRILVMDEPTSSLTQEDSQRLFEIIRGLKDQGVSIIYISHFLEEIQRVADSYTVLRDGRSVGSGTMEGTALEDIIQLMVGRKFTELFPQVEHAVGGPVLAVEGLEGNADDGAGHPDPGQGRDPGRGRPHRLRPDRDAADGLRARRRRGRNDRRLGRRARRADGRGPGSGAASASSARTGRERGWPWPVRRRQHDPERLGPLPAPRPPAARPAAPGRRRLDRKAQDQGQEPRPAGRRPVRREPAEGRPGPASPPERSVLLLDEPTRGIDVVSKSQIYEWIGGLAREGKAVLFVSSYLPELLGICDRIAVFHRGAPRRIAADRRVDAAALMAAATVGRTSPGTTHGSKERGMSRQRRPSLGKALNVFGPFIGLLLVIALFSLIPEVQGRFLRFANFKSVATQSVIVALGALGMTLIIIGGGIDLSAASNIALASVITAYAVNAGAAPLVAVAPRRPHRRPRRAGQRRSGHPAPARSVHRHPGHDGHRPGRGQVDRRQPEDRRAHDLGQRAHGQEPPSVRGSSWPRASGSSSSSPWPWPSS